MPINAISLTTLPDRLDLPAGTAVTLAGFSTMAGLSTTALAGFGGADPFLILSSGLAGDVDNPNDSGSQGMDLGSSGEAGDTISLTFTLPVPEDAVALSFAFSFLSEEFPEFVGSQYNDFFSAYVDGVQVAVDLAGTPISVNNSFFSGTLTPFGTQFDGQTPPLRITVPVTEGAESITLTLSVGDDGDGRYDSAAFVGDIGFVEPQVVYVQFDAGFLDFPAPWWNFLASDGFTLPGAGLSAGDQDAILGIVNEIYGDFLINFTNEQPLSGEYSTIHVGGTTEDLPDWMNAPANLLGRAESIDYGNEDRSDTAFVLAGEMPGNLALIAQVLAHEAGHILGLRHVADGAQLMYPFANAASTVIGGAAALAEIVDGLVTPVGGVQDSHAELVRNLGLRDAAQLVEAASFFDQLLEFLNFSSDSTAPVYDLRMVVFNSEGEVLDLVELGDLIGGTDVSTILPVTDGDTIVVIGKSSATGDYDVVLTDTTGGTVDFDALGESGILAELGIVVGDIAGATLGLSQVGAGGALTSIGGVTATVISAVGGTASDGADTLLGDDSAETMLALAGNDSASGAGGADMIYGNDGNDTLSGEDGDDVLDGGNDTDQLLGGAGNDSLEGGSGNDLLDGGAGADTMQGGTGNDFYVVDDIGDVVEDETVFGIGGGIDTVRSFFDYTAPANIELVRLGNLTDVTNLNATGNDAPGTLVGNAGANRLNGRGGNDQINGNAGNDTLIGGEGADTLVGGSGVDTFVFSSVSNSRAGALNRDVINGFDRGAVQDRIDLSAIDANTLTAGVNDAFSFIGSVAFSATGSAGQLRIQGLGGPNALILEADVNGDRLADMQIFVNLQMTMLATDFVL